MSSPNYISYSLKIRTALLKLVFVAVLPFDQQQKLNIRNGCLQVLLEFFLLQYSLANQSRHSCPDGRQPEPFRQDTSRMNYIGLT